MSAQPTANTLDGPTLGRVLRAGIRHVFSRRDYINKINVFPVPDGDTGTNMAFSFKTILDALNEDATQPLPELLGALTNAALDGARGNSGAIMAQYFEGFREGCGARATLTVAAVAAACERGAAQAWTAMSEPVPGTLPTVLEAHAQAYSAAASQGTTNLREAFALALAGAQTALENTPNQLPVLKQAGVVDAGGQGFVDLLEGMQVYITDGVMDELATDWDALDEEPDGEFAAGLDIGDHQFCTECVIEGDGLDRLAVMKTLQALDQSSMVVAGSRDRVRVHIHVNNPAEVFLACEAFGTITQQKADDMRWQHGLLNHSGKVAIVTDSGADLPNGEIERLSIHMVPVRLSFGDREYLDGVSLKPEEFIEMLASTEDTPRTSQPPPKDFRRVFELLTSHGYEVLYLGLSSRLSGTFQAGKSAAERMGDGQVSVFDTLNASCGQGLMAMVAAEAAAADRSREEITQLLEQLVPLTRVMAMPDELDSAVRGGRVPAWVGKLARMLRLTPVLTAKDGKMSAAGAHLGLGVNPEKFARRVLRALEDDESYWVMISHIGNAEGAQEMRRLILQGHPRIHSCHIAKAGPALGVHMGNRGLVVGFLPDPAALVHRNA